MTQKTDVYESGSGHPDPDFHEVHLDSGSDDKPMNSVIYNIPASMVETFRGKRMVVRASDPSEFVQNVLPSDVQDVAYVQLLALSNRTESLLSWGEGVPVDVVMDDPSAHFSQLYNFSALHHKHPVRVTIAVEPGFTNAVKLALALKFAVKLDIGQPDPPLIQELERVLDLYLHRSTIDQPVEFFQSIFLSFYNHKPASVWQIQEEDPDKFCFVTDEGEEVPSRRIANSVAFAEINAPDKKDTGAVRGEKSECDSCQFFDRCRGYFKLPDPDYDCAGIKTLFTTLRTAAEKVEGDLKIYELSKGGQPV